MGKPRPIKAPGETKIELKFVGGPWPYIHIFADGRTSWVEDRDVKRLHEWTARILAKRQRPQAKRPERRKKAGKA